ncbi:type II toxin-antitoxin system RelE/ParE family toxin [Serratia plymuthica]|uniref:type II toxin-antitoxin system RelE/ParE family toxin n=1 Tax=Serratia plymuthica TaxID=82996 RepID=UPI0018D9132F|nr:type II toxin-antitoxin system RelE/ParE family toxin [Serratia plymuthica]QPS57003.1 type II toxin-antitoxin system RelE/ParE family toxin [Serratia plymuthica]QPS87116.1 type II toxin-antitoxin system RelE/ParE family toxin [Serratia plymuthica]CAI1901030.1 Plasmid stabilisation system protein [Serratia plymuthica]
MTKVELAPEVRDDIERILAHLTHYEVADAGLRIQEIIQAIAVLEHNPLIGRGLGAGKRELIIGQQARGYVALYKYIPDIDTVFVLAIRSQKELGYE